MAFDIDRYTGSYALDSYSLRGMSYATRQAAKAKRSAYLAEAKAAKQRVSRTCQVCARMIYAETGTIAHHGYTRPGWGMQTPSCFGAKSLAFERSRDTLGAYIRQCHLQEAADARALAAVEADTCDLLLTWKEYYQLNGLSGAWNRREEEKRLPVNVRTNWAQLRADYPNAFKGRPTLTFGDLKRSAVMTMTRNLELLRQHIAEQQIRFDTWEQTES